MALDSTAIPLQATQAAVPVRRLGRRIAAFGWFLSHCIAIAVLTAIGAVVALAAVTLFCVAAPVAGVAFATAMHRRDLRLRAAAPA